MPDSRQDLAGNQDRLIPAGELTQNDDEFIASKTNDHITRAHGTTKLGGHLHQQSVPGCVSPSIVDDFETIEVNEQHRAFATAATGSLDG